MAIAVAGGIGVGVWLQPRLVAARTRIGAAAASPAIQPADVL